LLFFFILFFVFFFRDSFGSLWPCGSKLLEQVPGIGRERTASFSTRTVVDASLVGALLRASMVWLGRCVSPRGGNSPGGRKLLLARVHSALFLTASPPPPPTSSSPPVSSSSPWLFVLAVIGEYKKKANNKTRRETNSFIHFSSHPPTTIEGEGPIKIDQFFFNRKIY